MIDVIIPAYNEETTIGPIVRAFRAHDLIGNIWVMVDANTTDNTADMARANGSEHVHVGNMRGKGQMCAFILKFIEADRVIFSDADYTGVPSIFSIEKLCSPLKMDEMVIAVPRIPSAQEWEESKFTHPFFVSSWVENAGLRSVPTWLVKNLPLHGYLMETQINQAARAEHIWTTVIDCPEVIAPLRFTPERLNAMERDRMYGIQMGILHA
jgi:hypothetical protein